jgi:hypothetical protein
MTRTYSALLRGDRLEWTGENPGIADSDRPIAVTVVVDDSGETAPPAEDEAERWKKAVEALKRIAARGTLAAEIPDPVAWQREIRKDRPLLGREDE